ncbi:hypothetical protein CC78DRAFT_567932 [Lojkania enalia]|uniref:Uncharacterized protein n=1 Tax=Lojkania enalia TaxID=147567 RepID=A0A9P4KF28_9PLEO|nr:hypothetical protein CC78DRAFT_567932 [Didymosphaeria enalia]
MEVVMVLLLLLLLLGAWGAGGPLEGRCRYRPQSALLAAARTRSQRCWRRWIHSGCAVVGAGRCPKRRGQPKPQGWLARTAAAGPPRAQAVIRLDRTAVSRLAAF